MDKGKEKIIVQIPFSGFYYSHHSAEIDEYFNREFEYFAEKTGYDIPEKLANELPFAVDYGAIHEGYAKEYVESFLHEFGLEGEFESMHSPREYNFSTDRVFAYITRDSLAMMWRKIDKDAFDELCRENLTSRDGFISHYSNDWRDWGRISDWDYNQWGLVVRQFAIQESINGEFGSIDEFYLMEDSFCNGFIDNLIWGNQRGENGAKWFRLYQYLIDRAERPIKTLAQWRAANAKPFNSTPLGAIAGLQA